VSDVTRPAEDPASGVVGVSFVEVVGLIAVLGLADGSAEAVTEGAMDGDMDDGSPDEAATHPHAPSERGTNGHIEGFTKPARPDSWICAHVGVVPSN
jgi:hypothetical protein